MEERYIRAIKFTKSFKATQCNAAAQEREMREIKSTKRFNATQRSAAVQQREIRETKVGEGFQGNATQRGSAKERNQRNKDD